MLVYSCTNCDNSYRSWDWYSDGNGTELVCPNCSTRLFDFSDIPTLWGRSTPIAGEEVNGIPPETMLCYTEARVCATALCYAACEHMCRKVLMHVAVDHGAKEGMKFVQYLNFLEVEGHIGKNMKQWISLIKDHGNMAAHELEPVDRERALKTLYFTGALLKLMYEVPYKARLHLKPVE